MVYLVMRNWSKPCSENNDTRMFLSNIDETDWIYELDGYYRGPKQIMGYLYDVSYNSRSDFTKRIKLHISSLICSGLVILRNKITGHLYDSNEYMVMTKEEWGSGEDFVFYFPVSVGFYTVSNSGLETIIRLCKQNKDREVAYFVTLFAILEYYFSISADPSKCWMISPVSTFFTSRTSLWRRAKPILEAVGVAHTFKQYMDENGELKTKQVFERKMPNNSHVDSKSFCAKEQEDKSIYTLDDELPFYDENSFVSSTTKENTQSEPGLQFPAEKTFLDREFDYNNAKTPEEFMVNFTVRKCRDGICFPKLLGVEKTNQEFMDYLYDVDNHDFDSLPEYIQDILLSYCPEDVIPKLKMTKDEILELKLKSS